ncbi:hypothetical protein SGFS_077410 [Streptomyces graminofaciens]|uniref:Enolase C-terminal domain-containing protein n=1 Tax=Streptomyces graminofaciens TaxID=68212 RepID=A0ABM7FIF5_9ACTN|nr:hypothetical protein SGFS_077410 [Streptomyces graminofaciens]
MTTFAEIKEAFERDAVQVVLSDHHYWGGLRNTLQLAAICRTFEVGVSMHSNTHLGISLAAMTHVASTVPDLHHACDSHYPWQSEDVLAERLTFEDGRVRVSDAPGLGVDSTGPSRRSCISGGWTTTVHCGSGTMRRRCGSRSRGG